MLLASEIERIAEVCKSIGDDASDESGFVPVRGLLSRFNAELLLRPLLVEGMLASIEEGENGQEGTRWAVLVNSDEYPLSDDEIALESAARPLPPRFRNTVAHELVHSLAFRPSDFGMRLKRSLSDESNRVSLVRDIEAETERLSPLLLCTEKALKGLLANRTEPCRADELALLARNLGVSRYVLVNRLCLFSPHDSAGFRYLPSLRNLGVGIAEWTSGGRAVIRSWPLFVNFDRGIVPAFLLKLHEQDRSPASAILGEHSFAMCGGPDSRLSLDVDAGTLASPRSSKMSVQVSIEEGRRSAGVEFLFVVRRQGAAT